MVAKPFRQYLLEKIKPRWELVCTAVQFVWCGKVNESVYLLPQNEIRVLQLRSIFVKNRAIFATCNQLDCCVLTSEVALLVPIRIPLTSHQESHFVMRLPWYATFASSVACKLRNIYGSVLDYTSNILIIMGFLQWL